MGYSRTSGRSYPPSLSLRLQSIRARYAVITSKKIKGLRPVGLQPTAQQIRIRVCVRVDPVGQNIDIRPGQVQSIDERRNPALS